MLWWKEWRDSRERFLLMFAFLAATVIAIFLQGLYLSEMNSTEEIYLHFYIKWVPLAFFIFAPSLLGAGSLLQERGSGTAGLSLSLPVSRSRIVGVRLALGMMEFAALCCVPAALIPAMARIEGRSYPVSSAFHFAVLWMICGAALFAMSFLFSTLLAAQYAALTASIVTILTYYYVADTARFFRFYMGPVIVGLNTIVPGTAPNGLPEAFPWLDLSIIAAIAAGLFAVATQITLRQDF